MPTTPVRDAMKDDGFFDAIDRDLADDGFLERSRAMFDAAEKRREQHDKIMKRQFPEIYRETTCTSSSFPVREFCEVKRERRDPNVILIDINAGCSDNEEEPTEPTGYWERIEAGLDPLPLTDEQVEFQRRRRLKRKTYSDRPQQEVFNLGSFKDWADEARAFLESQKKSQ